MPELNEQTPAASTAGLLQQTEVEFCRLRSEREAIEIQIDEPGSKDSFRSERLRAELRSLGERMANTQIEMLEHRITLLLAHLPNDKDAIAPMQHAFDQAHAAYLEAAREREKAGAALHQAQTKVSCAESNISFYERMIQELKQKLASKGSPERSAGEIASELNDIEKRLGRLRTISSQLSEGS
jgi:chromosome segregation ATPase